MVLTNIFATTQSYCQTMETVRARGKCYKELGNTLPIWWYHPDHLGSSSYLTDITGTPSHYYNYLPFGEEMVAQNNSSYNNVYRFSAKELDEETGFYYYGARYYDPRISIWQSVDPLAEKFPNANPYSYCFQNPVNMIDPTGMEPDEPIMKNIYIVIDFNGTDHPSDKMRDIIEFKGMEKEGWHGIYAQNINDAKNQLADYLKGSNAETIVLESHGAPTYSDEELTNQNGNNFHTNNTPIETISTGDLDRSVNGLNNKNQADVNALISIVNSVKKGGDFYLNSCNTGDSDSFFLSLGKLTGNNVNLFGNMDLCSHFIETDKNPNKAIYSPKALFKEPFNIGRGYGKLFQAGCPDGPPIILLDNIGIDKNGLKY